MAAKDDVDAELAQLLAQLQFQDDDVNKLNKVYKARGQAGAQQFLEEKLNEWKNTPVNIAVIGASGVGKSTFVNTIRGLRGKDPGAAPVGTKQTTMKVTPYPHPRNENLVFWDIPGVGTKEFPKESYTKKIGIERFDFFLLLSAGRFTETDAWLGREISEKQRKKYYYVRTKVDQDVENDREDSEDHDVDRVLNDVRQDIQHNLATGNKVNGLFLVAGRRPNSFEFPKLEKSLIDDFPESKRSALILSMCAMSESLVKMKIAQLRKGMKYSAMGAGGVAVVPIPLVSLCYDTLKVDTEAKEYFFQLGLDDDSLRKMADMTGCSFNGLQAVVREALGSNFCETYDTCDLLFDSSRLNPTLVAIFAQRIIQLLPVAGGLFASPITIATTYKQLEFVLSEMEKVALNVIRYINEHSTL
jgi:predicted GTPase